MAEIIPRDGQEFGKIRRILFPLYMFELKKAIPMGLIFFCVLFIYTCLRNIKDTLVITGPCSHAEIIPFLKGYCVAPAAIIITLLYAKASNIFSNEHLFYVSITSFILFWGGFGFLIYPNVDALHVSAETMIRWQAQAPDFLHWPIVIIGNWSYSLFYILAEIWGSAGIPLLFWQFANQITKMKEARRMYTYFSLVAQTSVLIAGQVGMLCSDIRTKVATGVDPWGVSLKLMMGVVVLSGITAMLIYRWIYKYVLTDKRFYDKPELPGNTGKHKKKPPLWQSLRVIFTSPHLGLIAALVICYGTSINLFEGLWRKQIAILHSDPNDHNTFMNQFTFYGGLAPIILLIIGGNIIRNCRWFVASITTPIVILLSGTSFFIFFLCRDSVISMFRFLSDSPTLYIAIFASFAVAASRATKYALFDLTKEMAYIPLDEEMKVKGKAVVEVVGARFGKAGGAWIQSLLLILIPGSTLASLAPYTFVAFIIICVVWIFAVKTLSPRVESFAEKPTKS